MNTVFADTVASFRSELLKLRRRSLLLGTLAATLVATAIGAIPMFVGLDKDMTGPGGQRVTRATLKAAGGLAKGIEASSTLFGVLVLSLAAISVANEYSHGTMRNLLVRQPRRGRVLAGKVMATATLSTAVVVIGTVMSVAVMALMAPTASVTTAAWWTGAAFSTLIGTALRVIVTTWVFAAVGIVLGFVTRSAAASIGIGAAWLIIGESLLGGISDTLAKGFPGKLASAFSSGGTTQISMTLAIAGVATWIALLVTGAFAKFRSTELS